MKRTYGTLVFLAALAAGCADRDTLYQTSTVFALMEGAYDGNVSCGQLKQRGDFGIGTFDKLDGEMVVLGGTVYQVRADGSVHKAPDALTTPFAAVTFFDTDKSATTDKAMNFSQLTKYIDAMLPTANVPYAVHVRGRFRYVKTRSVPPQKQPYPRLAEVAKSQPEFEFRWARGDLVGFRMPGYARGINVAGYHLHFLTDDRAGGGHVLEVQTDNVTIAIDDCDALHLSLPKSAAFRKANLTRQDHEALKAIEK